MSRDKREVLKKIALGDGVKAESLACVPKTRKVLVVDAKGHLCEVDCQTEKVERVASAGSRPEAPRRFRKLDVVVDLSVVSQRADRARKGARSASEKGTGPIPPRERVGARAPSRALED